MSQPSYKAPAPPPNKGGTSLLSILLLLLIVAVGVAYWRGWFDFNKNPDTNKRELTTNADKMKGDLAATKKWFGETWTKTKDKLASAKNKLTTTKTPDNDKLSKEIDDVTREIDEAEKNNKPVDDALKEKLKNLEDRVNKMMAEKAPEKPKT
jgi:hypothetical protein